MNKVEIGLNTIQQDDGASILENSGRIYYLCGPIKSYINACMVSYIN